MGTLRRLACHSEPYGSTGNIGENFRRLLGMPAHDPLHTVIREAVQNIADAAKLGSGPEILIRIRSLTGKQRRFLREYILAELPVEPTSLQELQGFLEKKEPVVLEICDFRTTGLGGPTRADRIPKGTSRMDFVNFLRNIGTPPDTEHGGGTYGFGKASFYAVSRCQTILVDTQVIDEPHERRFIGCHVGARFERSDGQGMMRQFTGRHWWGVLDPDEQVADPALGDLAAKLAAGIGMPERTMNSQSSSGTSIMILDPDLHNEDLEVAGYRIVEALLWSYWPRMMRDAPREKKFACRVMVNEKELDIPRPENFPPLDLFCKAMTAVRRKEGSDIRKIVCGNPKKELGTLAIEKGLRAPRRTIVAEDSLFSGDNLSCSIALMRPVEMVVKYLTGKTIPDNRFEWAGVFLASNDDEVERAFAMAEPPAHDDWIPTNLSKGRARTFVQVALRRLAEQAEAMGGLAAVRPTRAEKAPALARVAGRLGETLSGQSGEGAGRYKTGKSGKGGKPVRRAKAMRPIFETLLRKGDSTLAVFSTEVKQDPGRTGKRLSAVASIALEGRSAHLGDAFVTAPKVLGIRASDGGQSFSTDTIDLNGAEGRYEIYVLVPADCAVTVSVELQTGVSD